MTDTENKQNLSFDEDSKFREYYTTHLMKEFILLEAKRKQYVTKFFVTLFLFVLVGITGVILYKNIALDNIIGLVVFLLLGVLVYYLMQPFKNYKKDTKKIIMPELTKFFDNVAYFQNENGIDINILKKSDLFMGMEKVYCDDSFEGIYQETKFQLAEQRITTYVHTKNGRRESTMFNGILLQFQFGKKFSGQTVVKDKRGRFLAIILLMLFLAVFAAIMVIDPTRIRWDDSEYFIYYLGMLGYMYWHRKYRKVHLEDVVFSKHWSVLATDQIEARYILTPALMEKILKIKKMFSAHSISFAFFDDKVLIAISTNKDMFETTSLFSYAINYRKAKDVVIQFYSIFAIIKDIKQSTLDKLQKK